MRTLRKVSVTVDGGKHHEQGTSWVGVVVRDAETGEVLKVLSGPCAVSGSNRCEYAAINAGCQELLIMFGHGRFVDATIFTDSQICVRQLSGAYNVRDERIKPLYHRAIRMLNILGAKICWHSREDGDGPLADKLSKGLEVNLGKNNGIPVCAC